MAKVFEKFGLKKELNLSDLGNAESALNTLLSRLDEGFNKKDLELITDSYLTDIDSDTFVSAAQSTVLLSRPGLPPVIYEPLITLQNRIDRAYFTTSEPFFFGGDGLTTRYFDSFQIKRTGVGDGSTPGNFYFNPKTPFIEFQQTKDPVTGRGTGGEIFKEIYWETGNFNFGSKINNLLLSSYGGVEWTGFIKPTASGQHSFTIRTDGYVRIEFDSLLAKDKEFTFDPATETSQLNDLDFTNTGLITLVDQTRAVDKGEIVNFVDGFGTTNIAFAGENYGTLSPISTSGSGVGGSFQFRRDSSGKLFVVDISQGQGGRLYQAGDSLTFSAASFNGSEASNVVVIVDEVSGLEFYNDLTGSSTGIEITGSNRTINVNLGNLRESVPYKIRISYFIDDDTATIVNRFFNKTFDIDFNRPDSSGSLDTFDYKYTFNENYFDRYNLGDFKKFIDSSINIYGTNLTDLNSTIGLGSPTEVLLNNPGEKYQNLINLKPITSFYVCPLDIPVASLTQNRTGTASTSGTIVLNATSGNVLDGIEEGNYVQGPGLYVGTRVVNKGLTNNTLTVSPSPFANQSGTFNFIPHKGLVAYGSSGSYSTLQSSGERGYYFGNRVITRIQISEGSLGGQPNQDYTNGGLNPISVENNPGLVTTDSETGSGASFNITRNSLGTLQVSINNGGNGYTNGNTFVIDGSLIGNGTTDLVIKVTNLSNSFFIGEPSKIITGDQIFKESNIQGSLNFNYLDKIEDPNNGIQKTAVNSALIERIEYDQIFPTGIEKNTIIFKNQTTLPAQIPDSTPNNGTWFIYQTFGLNNDGLASFCRGTSAKRILQKLTQTITGGTYAPYSTPVTITTTSGSGTGMTVKYRLNGSNNIEAAWVVDPGIGYVSGDTINIPGSIPEAVFRVGYTDLSGDVTLRLENSRAIEVGMYAHLFPSIRFQTTTLTGSNNNSVDLLSSDVTITNIFKDPDDPAGAAEVTLSAGGANVLNSVINFVSTVVTKVTFSFEPDNKEVCFRPTDTSPPFNATAFGLATSNDVKCVYEFTGSTAAGAQPGVFNPNSKISYNALSLNTFEDKITQPAPLTNNVRVVGADTINGRFPIQTPAGTFYILLGTA